MLLWNLCRNPYKEPLKGTVLSAMNKESSLDILRLMLDSRFFEEKTEELFKAGLIHGTTHLANGQEAAQAGLCYALEDGDWIVPTHRCHGFTICRGSDPYAMFSEMFGSIHGLAKGLGGSMHMPDSSHWNLGSSAVVGSGVPLATGIAFWNKFQSVGNAGFATSSFANPKNYPQKPVKNISVAIFGDGASSRGSVHESMNLASIWKLPVLFYCENNQYGMSASSDKMISSSSVASRAMAYEMPGETIDGNDVLKVIAAVKKACSYIKAGHGPYLLEVMTYRTKGHSKSDRRLYRTEAEEKMWLDRDPIKLYEKKLVEEGLCTQEEIENLEIQRKEYIDQKAQKALLDSKDRLSECDVEEMVYATKEDRE